MYMYSLRRVAAGGGGARALLHALRHYALWVKIILADFNLAVSTLTAKPPNLIPRQIFWLYGSRKCSPDVIVTNLMKFN